MSSIELETQAREERQIQVRDRRPVQSQPTTKRSKHADSRVRGQKGHTYSKCGRRHKVPIRLGTACQGLSQGASGLLQLQLDGSLEGQVSSACIQDGSDSDSCNPAYYGWLAGEGRGSEGSRERILVDSRGSQGSNRHRGQFVFFIFLLIYLSCL